ncbi:alpha/beta fold hydrolase [Pseudomonas cedrina]|uniref:alpha/beta fold hydrolase n=1 Tax=Pseudomonas cedrina TaxID=651740 RepID=UPI001E5CFF93|nr:alpha/beta fold hydrolase [Pseudomonas cedrina]
MDAPRQITYEQFPPIERPRRSGMLAVDDLHTLYWEESGNPDGVPVVYVHGGPGEGAPPTKRQFWDPDHYRIVLFDQRGALRSTPLAELRNNTTQALVSDLEALREHLGIDRWLITAGSWGTTLALAYGEAHPQRCLGFILRGCSWARPTRSTGLSTACAASFPAPMKISSTSSPKPNATIC